ncbi:hypothetical protein B0H10DRAFT_334091 [Mycena sp. CBHHK59/15]|nr:hypothetical protein B0H10DRAFT_334091 [Mycena sp. CBHHK59/15]
MASNRYTRCHLLRGGALLRAVPPLLYNWRNETIFPEPLLAYFSYSFRMSAPLPCAHGSSDPPDLPPRRQPDTVRPRLCTDLPRVMVRGRSRRASRGGDGRGAASLAEPARAACSTPATLKAPRSGYSTLLARTRHRQPILDPPDDAAQQVWWRPGEEALDEELDTFLRYRVGTVGEADVGWEVNRGTSSFDGRTARYDGRTARYDGRRPILRPTRVVLCASGRVPSSRPQSLSDVRPSASTSASLGPSPM